MTRLIQILWYPDYMNISCSTIGCKNKVLGRGMCRSHYKKLAISMSDKRDVLIEDGVAKIPLGVRAKNGYSLIDIDNAHVAANNWCMNSSGYAVCGKDGKMLYLHRLVSGISKEQSLDGLMVDHINQNKLDNRRSNLRIVTRCSNLANSKLQSRNTSGYRGVSYDSGRKDWVATLTYARKLYSIGRFKNKQDAALAYNKKALEVQGEYAVLNVVRSNV